MGKEKEWYTLEKTTNGYMVWHYKETEYQEHGSYGSLGLYSSEKKEDCLKYCDEHKIKIKYRRKNDTIKG